MKKLLLLIILFVLITPVSAQETKRICVNNPYGRVWDRTIQQAINEFNRYVPSEWVDSDCHIVVNVVNPLPCEGGFTGCTYPNRYPVEVYLDANYSQRLTNTLHELFHAYGFWDHAPPEIESVSNSGFYFYRRLQPFDIEWLRSTYGS